MSTAELITIDLCQILSTKLAPLIERIANHPVSSTIDNFAALRQFTQHHVFAVWDFFCLLKALYRQLACTDIIWHPPRDPHGAALIHSILADEEGDLVFTTEPISHFSWYLKAMEDCGADTRGIQGFLSRLNFSTPIINSPFNAYQRVSIAITHPCVPIPAQAFVKQTFRILCQPLSAIAGAFVFGREAITDRLFLPIITQLERLSSRQYNTQGLSQYFERHVTLDHEDHYPKALQLLSRLCGNDPNKWQSAQEGAEQALRARLTFLDAICVAIKES